MNEQDRQEDEKYSHLSEETISIINDMNKVKVEVTGGEGDMCKAFEDYRLRGREEGRESGIKEERKKRIKLLVDLVNDKILNIDEAAMRMGVSSDEFTEMMKNE